MGDTPKAERDGALAKFRKLGYRFFRRGFVRDCARYLANTYGGGWSLKLRSNKKVIWNKMGRDQEAVVSMLWHATRVSWFNHNAGARLIHFWFPVRY